MISRLPKDDPRRLKVATLLEKKRRTDLVASMEQASFEHQWKFIRDEATLKAALTTRRAGKSNAIALDFLETSERFPGVSMAYTGLTDDSAKRIIWKDAIKPLAKKFDIPVKLRRSDCTITNERTGAVLYMFGINAGEEEMAKLFGPKWKRIYVDEGATYTIDLETFIYQVCMPGLVDLNGQLVLVGMPNNNANSFFAKVTQGLSPGWSLHKWTAFDNPYVAEKFRKQIEFYKRTNPGFLLTPLYRQQYLGEWVVDASALVYRFDDSLFVDALPDASPMNPWHYVDGTDLGYDDPSGFVVLAYRDYDPDLYVVEAYKRSGMTITDVAERLRHHERIYRPERHLIDNANKQAVEELKQRFGLALTPAEKAGKADFIQIVNDDLRAKRIKFVRAHTEPLVAEMRTLTWDEKKYAKGQYVEAPRRPNHCCDAFLYPWRYCYNWVDRGVQNNPRNTTEQEIDNFWKRECERGEMRALQPSPLEMEYGYVQ